MKATHSAAELLGHLEAEVATRPKGGGEPAPKPHRSVMWWHEALADWMLLNPDKYLKEAAPVFGVSIGYIYILHNSDSFQSYWHERRTNRAKTLDEETGELLGSLQDKLSAVAALSLDSVLEGLQKNTMSGGTMIPQSQLLDTADMALKRLGYGAPSPPPPGGGGVTTNVQVVVGSEMLAKARAKMLELHGTPVSLPAPDPKGGTVE